MIDLLKHLIATPSPSRGEEGTARILFEHLRASGASPKRIGNNVWALSQGYDPERPTVMLNSHHDTVRPSAGYTRDPYSPTICDGRLYGLGSNDAGASVAALTQAFLDLQGVPLSVNLLLALTAEEEVGGENGMRLFLPAMERDGIRIDCAIVGEPTGMDAAVGERGLVVLDCTTPGVAGHAARKEGVNAIYRAMEDIQALRDFQFPRESALLGPVGVNVTQINAGTQHNVVPDLCTWVADIRTTDAFSNEETVELLRGAVRHSELRPRSTRVRASAIGEEHPLVRAAAAAGARRFVSPTTSDMSLMHGFPTLKIGPGDSARSHKADEYILLAELEEGLETYKKILRSPDLAKTEKK